MVLAGPAMLAYAVGIPLVWYLLVRRFKRQGRLDDPRVIRMIGFIYKPYRKGCERRLN